MIRNIFKAPPDPKGINSTDAASNDTMTKTQTQTATERLTALRDHEQASLTALIEAQNQYRRTSMELSHTRDVVRGYERSTRPAEMAIRDEAQARLVRLQEQAQTENALIAALEGELNAAKARITALFEGQGGHEVAVTIYREATARVAEAESALATHQAQRQTAALALDKAEQASATAARDLADALDPASINRARATLTKTQQAEDDARTLVGNLQRHEEKLAAECTAALLADALKQQLTGSALAAYAAARLAGSGFGFKAWLANTLNPHEEYLLDATEAHQATLVAELETATALEKVTHA